MAYSGEHVAPVGSSAALRRRQAVLTLHMDARDWGALRCAVLRLRFLDPCDCDWPGYLVSSISCETSSSIAWLELCPSVYYSVHRQKHVFHGCALSFPEAQLLSCLSHHSCPSTALVGTMSPLNAIVELASVSVSELPSRSVLRPLDVQL